ncbi:hypothetical protein [Alteraurantiacibacter palmitatis]|uniref:Alpha/beta hydrolase n=1 Tax=Alteraurantiacibacter palmitatis TaxID=2054628 RepID=A0ABV7E4I7_9SPHN
MHFASYTAPGGQEELALTFGDPSASTRLLVLPAWFDEANKLRHFSVELMRALERAGVASVLPDLPGCNESLAPLAAHDLASWRSAALAASQAYGCTHVLAIRAGVNLAPDLPGWAYAPLAGKAALRALLRARVVAAKEAGRSESSEALLQTGKNEGLALGGYHLGAEMVAALARAELPAHGLHTLTPADFDAAGLWLRAEPDHDGAQAEALAARIVQDVQG